VTDPAHYLAALAIVVGLLFPTFLALLAIALANARQELDEARREIAARDAAISRQGEVIPAGRRVDWTASNN